MEATFVGVDAAGGVAILWGAGSAGGGEPGDALRLAGDGDLAGKGEPIPPARRSLPDPVSSSRSKLRSRFSPSPPPPPPPPCSPRSSPSSFSSSFRGFFASSVSAADSATGDTERRFTAEKADGGGGRAVCSSEAGRGRDRGGGEDALSRVAAAGGRGGTSENC